MPRIAAATLKSRLNVLVTRKFSGVSRPGPPPGSAPSVSAADGGAPLSLLGGGGATGTASILLADEVDHRLGHSLRLGAQAGVQRFGPGLALIVRVTEPGALRPSCGQAAVARLLDVALRGGDFLFGVTSAAK